MNRTPSSWNCVYVAFAVVVVVCYYFNSSGKRLRRLPMSIIALLNWDQHSLKNKVNMKCNHLWGQMSNQYHVGYGKNILSIDWQARTNQEEKHGNIFFIKTITKIIARLFKFWSDANANHRWMLYSVMYQWYYMAWLGLTTAKKTATKTWQTKTWRTQVESYGNDCNMCFRFHLLGANLFFGT